MAGQYFAGDASQQTAVILTVAENCEHLPGHIVICIHFCLFKETTYIKVTVHVGTDQNFEIEIFAEYKYTLNELSSSQKNFFNTSNSLQGMTNTSFYRK